MGVPFCSHWKLLVTVRPYGSVVMAVAVKLLTFAALSVATDAETTTGTLMVTGLVVATETMLLVNAAPVIRLLRGATLTESVSLAVRVSVVTLSVWAVAPLMGVLFCSHW